MMCPTPTRQLAATLTLLITAAFSGAGVAVARAATSQSNAPQRYTVTDLGTFGSGSAFASGINDQGGVAGAFGTPNQHAFVWRRGSLTDLGTLGGPNSGPGDFPLGQEPGPRGQIVGAAETSTTDPLREGFCNFLLFSPVTDRRCLPFVWQNGAMSPLPTLGGTNGGANDMNSRGQVVGIAENDTLDPTCSAPHLHFLPVIWEQGIVHQLPAFPGDPDGGANAINERGQIVGATGNCTTSFHAVLWHHGALTDLGSLGGTSNIEPMDINDHTQVVGFSDLQGDTTFHAFLWQHGDMTDLGTLPGDASSLASAINGKGQVVGTSFDASGNPRAFVWQNDTISDLNTLAAPASPLSLLFATGINSHGQIVGLAATPSGELHAYVATPEGRELEGAIAHATQLRAIGRRRHVGLAANARKLLRQRLRFGRRGPLRPWSY